MVQDRITEVASGVLTKVQLFATSIILILKVQAKETETLFQFILKLPIAVLLYLRIRECPVAGNGDDLSLADHYGLYDEGIFDDADGTQHNDIAIQASDNAIQSSGEAGDDQSRDDAIQSSGTEVGDLRVLSR